MRRAVVVGCDRYSSGSGWTDLPSVKATFEDLCSTLVGYCGYDGKGVGDLLNPTIEQVAEALGRAASEPSSQLLFYFMGHANIGHDGRLRMALVRSDSREYMSHTMLDYETVRRVLEAALDRRATKSVSVVLDCCFAGRASAIGGKDVEHNTRFRDAAVILATSDSAAAYAPKKRRYTAFSGALIDAVLTGVSDTDSSAPVTWAKAYEHIRRQVPAARGYFTDSGPAIILTNRNRITRPMRGAGVFEGIDRPTLMKGAAVGFGVGAGAGAGVAVVDWEELWGTICDIFQDNLA